MAPTGCAFGDDVAHRRGAHRLRTPHLPPVSAPPQAPPTGPCRTHRKVMLILFAGVAGLIFISFLIISLFFLLLLFAS